MENILVTVLLPVYNGEKYILRSIKSILCQSYTNFELIVINDGSSDNTSQIVMQMNDPRIIFVDNKVNKGLIQTLNYGITIAKGKYIIRMDSDDIALKNRIKKQVEFMEANLTCDICGGNYIRMLNDNLFVDRIKNLFIPGRKSKVFCSFEDIKSSILFLNPIIHPTAIIRRKSIEYQQLVYNENYKYAEDYEFWINAMKKNLIIRNINDYLIKYRIHRQSISRDSNNLLKKIETLKKIDLLLIELYDIESTKFINYHRQINFFSINEFRIYISSLNEMFYEVINKNKVKSTVFIKAFKKYLRNIFMNNKHMLTYSNYRFVINLNSNLRATFITSKIISSLYK